MEGGIWKGKTASQVVRSERNKRRLAKKKWVVEGRPRRYGIYTNTTELDWWAADQSPASPTTIHSHSRLSQAPRPCRITPLAVG